MPATDPTLIERLRAGFGRRAVGITLALALELLILLLLLTLGEARPGQEEGGPALTTFDARPEAEPEAEEEEVQEEQAAERPAPSQPTEAEPVRPEPVVAPSVPQPRPSPSAFIPLGREQMAQAEITPPAPPAPARPRAVLGPVQGPPAGPQDRGGGAGADSEVVGAAPDGSPLYAAAWYRRPYDDELKGYLSTASGPGWGLIACRTAPEWRVEDCVALDESPRGSNIARSVLAAAWQFKVRPPRVGGQSLVGSWVRIRIDYGIRPR